MSLGGSGVIADGMCVAKCLAKKDKNTVDLPIKSRKNSLINSQETPKQNIILVIDSDKEQLEEMSVLLARENYLSNPIAGTADLERTLSEGNPLAVIIDIDTVDIDNRQIRDLTMKYPGLIIFCVSKHRFHPELQNAICYHIFACLNRPINPEELFYFLKSLDTDAQRKNNSQKI